MEKDLKREIQNEIQNGLINGICASGANIAHMKHLLKGKYVSKKKMLIALETQMLLLGMIQTSKNVLLGKLEEKPSEQDIDHAKKHMERADRLHSAELEIRLKNK